MRKVFVCVALFFLVTFSTNLPVFAQFGSSISGVIFDANNHRPVSDVYVELMNELYSTIKRIRIDGSGRYSFTGLSRGRYKIKVTTLGTNYLEQTQDAELVTLTIANRETTDSVYVDFYLKLDPRKVPSIDGTNGVVFAQDIPEEAKKLYQKGIEEVADKKEIGYETIEKAIQIFPNYYYALDFLGNEYVQKEKYEKALPYLIRAIDINQRSFSSFYALGYACYKIGKYSEGIEASKAATILAPQSINAHLLYGTILRLDKQYATSEKELKLAKTLSKDTPIAEIHWQLGLLYNKLNRNTEAADELEIFLKIQPKNPDAQKIKELIAKLRASNTKTN